MEIPEIYHRFTKKQVFIGLLFRIAAIFVHFLVYQAGVPGIPDWAHLVLFVLFFGSYLAIEAYWHHLFVRQFGR